MMHFFYFRKLPPHIPQPFHNNLPPWKQHILLLILLNLNLNIQLIQHLPLKVLKLLLLDLGRIVALELLESVTGLGHQREGACGG